MQGIIRIAIDGPGGAGKSTIAKALATRLSIDYIDTGAMYRALGLKLLRNGINLEDKASLSALLKTTEIDFQGGNTLLDGEIVNDFIRTPEVAKMASDCSALGEVREKLVQLQRQMGQTKSVVMDGRDIGTNVLTDAEYKFYMTASPEERANRRYLELMAKGDTISYEQVLSDMNQRDANDMNRALNPLRKAEDAVEINTDNMGIEEVISAVMNYVR